MADDASYPTDFWRVLEKAREEVARWEEWQRQYRADIYYEGYPAEPVKVEASTASTSEKQPAEPAKPKAS